MRAIDLLKANHTQLTDAGVPRKSNSHLALMHYDPNRSLFFLSARKTVAREGGAADVGDWTKGERRGEEVKG